MFRVLTGASFGLRCSVVVFVSAFAFVSLTAPADARKRKGWSKRSAATQSYSPRYADIVVDANTGDVLHSTSADAQRHPASLTKIMTLYLLFERLEAGKIRLDSQMEVSAHASRQPPTKLGLRAGQTLKVEDAIMALVTKSANDAAVVIAEALGESEEQFAVQMTRKARALRMTRTVYKNASGLPDTDQITTARDQALLGLAVQERFPRYYRYFATESFAYRGIRMANHNKLLGRVDGVTGIKTGYTRASGFNLVSAVERGDRRIVAVVLGGTSGRARDAKMRGLIAQKFSLASVKRTAPKIVEIADAGAAFPTPISSPAPASQPIPVPQAAPALAAPTLAAPTPAAPVERPVRVASTSATIPTKTRNSAVSQTEQPSPGSTEPIKPRLVRTLSVKAGPVRTASAPMSLIAPEPLATRTSSGEVARAETVSDALPPPPPGARPGVLGVLSSKDIASRDATPSTITASVTPMVPAARAEAAASVQTAKAEAPAVNETKKRSGWIIQVGAFDDASEAKEKLAEAKNKANLLKDAEPFTEIFEKGDKRYYRARFAGLRESAAERACRQLKKNQIACFAVKN